VDDEAVAQLNELLGAVAPLCASKNVLVRISAERIAAIVVDVLFELDPGGLDHPWDALPWVGVRS
jgi:hypothetical protein